MASAIRSWYEPVGLAASIFTPDLGAPIAGHTCQPDHRRIADR
jgi:hypothetical protein